MVNAALRELILENTVRQCKSQELITELLVSQEDYDEIVGTMAFCEWREDVLWSNGAYIRVRN